MPPTELEKWQQSIRSISAQDRLQSRSRATDPQSNCLGAPWVRSGPETTYQKELVYRNGNFPNAFPSAIKRGSINIDALAPQKVIHVQGGDHCVLVIVITRERTTSNQQGIFKIHTENDNIYSSADSQERTHLQSNAYHDKH